MIRAVLLFAMFLVLGVPAKAERRVTIFAAASLAGALEEIAAPYDRPVSLSFGGSGAMARQVSAGAPADVIILASPLWMDWVATQGVVSVEDIQPVAQNRLVVIGPAGASPLSGADEIFPRLGGGRLAMGQRDAVPAGSYAREWLQAAGVWDALTGHLAETDNVRAALALVARGQAPLGVVYASDAVSEGRVSVVLEVPKDSHGPITYPAAALTEQGRAFLAYLLRDDAQATFAARGFGRITP